MTIDPLTHKLVARTKAQDTLGETFVLDPAKPLLEASGGLLPGERHSVVPEVLLVGHHEVLAAGGNAREGAVRSGRKREGAVRERKRRPEREQ